MITIKEFIEIVKDNKVHHLESAVPTTYCSNMETPYDTINHISCSECPVFNDCNSPRIDDLMVVGTDTISNTRIRTFRALEALKITMG